MYSYGLGPKALPIYEVMRERIVTGAYAPGAKLPPHTVLAREFGVASLTVRQVLAYLEQEGLLAIEQGRGTFVRSGSGEGAHEPVLGERARRRERDRRLQAEATAERLRALQALTESLSGARTTSEVTRIVMDRLAEMHVADAAMLWVLTPDETSLTILDQFGFTETIETEFRQLSLAEHYPVCRAVRTARPVWIRSIPEWRRRAQDPRGPARMVSHDSGAALPLVADGHAVGALVLAFKESREFDAAGMAFLETIGRQCAQAMDRARLHEAQARMATIVDSSEDAIVSVRADGIIQSWNSAAEALFGYSEGEALGQPLAIIVPPGNEDDVHDRLRRALSGERVQRFAATRRRKDGSRVDVSMTVFALRDPDGSVRGAGSIARDLTEALRTEARLHLSEERYRSLAEAASDGIALTSVDGIIMLANRRLAEIFGYEGPEDLVGMTPLDLVAPESLPLVQRRFPQWLAGELATSENVRYFGRRKDGTQFPGFVNGVLVRGPGGAPQGFTFTVRDVTEVEAGAQALQVSEQRYRLMMRNAPVGVTLNLPNGRFLEVNPAYERMTGYSAEELKRMTFQEMTYPEDLEANLALLRELLEGKRESYEMDKRYLRHDGSILPGRVSVALVRDAAGNPLYTIAVVEDVTAHAASGHALNLTQSNYEELVQRAPFAVAIHTGGRLRYVNEAAVRLMQAGSAENLLGKSLIEIAHPDGRQDFAERVQQALLDGSVLPDFEERFVRLDGQTIDVKITSTPVTFGGEPALQVVMLDITARKALERAHLDAERRYHALLEISPDAIVVLNAHGQIVTANMRYAELLGLQSPEQLVGRRALEFVSPEEQAALVDVMRRRLHDGMRLRVACTMRREDGSRFLGEYHVNTVDDGNDKRVTIAILRVAVDRRFAVEERDHTSAAWTE